MAQERRALLQRPEGECPRLIDFVLPNDTLEFTGDSVASRLVDDTFSVVTYAEAVKAQVDFYSKPISEQTEQEYDERRGILPPAREASLNGWAVFYIPEMLIYDVARWCAQCHYTGRFYTWCGSTRAKLETLVENLEAFQAANPIANAETPAAAG